MLSFEFVGFRVVRFDGQGRVVVDWIPGCLVFRLIKVYEVFFWMLCDILIHLLCTKLNVTRLFRLNKSDETIYFPNYRFIQKISDLICQS